MVLGTKIDDMKDLFLMSNHPNVGRGIDLGKEGLNVRHR